MKKMLKKLKPQVMQIFHHLHRHPEISWKEYKTTEYIAQFLQNNGCQVRTFSDCTGVVGEWGSGSPTIALRADMDALWQSVNGSFQANHSCGHDAHMTMVLGTILLLKEMSFAPKGKLKLIFQPAEEKGAGALRMIEKGLIDDVDYLYGVHLRPSQEVENRKAAPAIIHGASQKITGEIIGQEAHGAKPHLGINAIEVGASVVNALGKIHVDPMIPYSVKMTRFQAGGESGNIIPGYAQFTLDLRAQTNQQMEALFQKVEKVVKVIAELYSVEIALEYGFRLVAAEVNDEAKKIMSKSIVEALGKANLIPPVVTSGGEDFHFYIQKRPELKATMLGLGCDLYPGLHHPEMTFDREALLVGIEILTKTVLQTFEQWTPTQE
ncbi:M20 peptidase aminoacylase family protein [Caldalkalibacillus mannanilyticus]|uniref:M20 peptidase aminoacylase family protein n=1 Tax=Caldalkalibacillus mannanilyticus TaxID=1418 RepID=UPI0004699C1C|nr:M20 peptidase aminoacylase family protein [Caldalkalibacillus mannanilyticus]